MCDSNVTKATPTEKPRYPGGDTTYSWVNLQDSSQCAIVFKHLKGNTTEQDYIDLDLYNYQESSLEKQYAAYQETLKIIFINSTFNVSNVEDHIICLDLKLNYTTLDNLLILMVQLAVNISESETYNEAYGYAVQVPPLYRDVLRHDEKFWKTTLKDACGWLSDYAQDTRNNKYTFQNALEKVKGDMDAALLQFNNLNNYFLKLNNEMLNKIEPTIRLGKEYLERNITKVKLAEEFLTPYFTKAVQNLADISADITHVNRNYNEETVKVREKLVQAYRLLFKFKLPVINNYNVYKLGLVESSSGNQ